MASLDAALPPVSTHRCFLPTGFKINQEQLKGDPELLGALLNYHVVPDRALNESQVGRGGRAAGRDILGCKHSTASPCTAAEIYNTPHQTEANKPQQCFLHPATALPRSGRRRCPCPRERPANRCPSACQVALIPTSMCKAPR